MSLRTMRCALVSEVRAPRSRVVFDEAALRQPELAALGDPQAVATALSDESEETIGPRELVVAAILREHQAQPHALWSALLLTAYAPMLARLHGRLRGGGKDELEQIVLASFLEAVRRVPAEPGRISVRLRCDTQRQVFRFLGRELRHADCGEQPGDDDRPPPGGRPLGRNLDAASVVDEIIDRARAEDRPAGCRARRRRRPAARGARTVNHAVARAVA